MAVIPAWQSKGIESDFIKAGLKKCCNSGHEIVVVLGHPNFYPRFGFMPAVTKESIIDRINSSEISPNPSLTKRGIPPFVKGGKEGFNLLCLQHPGGANKFGSQWKHGAPDAVVMGVELMQDTLISCAAG